MTFWGTRIFAGSWFQRNQFMRLSVLFGVRSPLVMWPCPRPVAFVICNVPEMPWKKKEGVLNQRRGWTPSGMWGDGERGQETRVRAMQRPHQQSSWYPRLLMKGQALAACSRMHRNLAWSHTAGEGRGWDSHQAGWSRSLLLTSTRFCFPNSCFGICFRCPVPRCVDGVGGWQKGVLKVCRITRWPGNLFPSASVLHF